MRRVEVACPRTDRAEGDSGEVRADHPDATGQLADAAHQRAAEPCGAAWTIPST
jgi:hypothetical protein